MVKNEFKVGLTIVVAVIVGFVGFRVMKDIPIFRLGTIIYADYPKVDGLNNGTSITIRGIKVGVVQRLALLPNDSVRVTLNINMIEGLPVGSVAYIRSVDILGTKTVEIERGISNDLVMHQNFIKGVYDEGSIAKIQDVGEDIGKNVLSSAESVSSVMAQLDTLLRSGAKEDISGLLQNLNNASSTLQSLLDEKNDDIIQSINNIREMTQNLENLTSEEAGYLQNTLVNLEQASGEISELANNLNESVVVLSEILQKINSGEGSIGKLINDPTLYDNLEKLTGNLNALVEEVRENPRHFLKHMKLIEVF